MRLLLTDRQRSTKSFTYLQWQYPPPRPSTLQQLPNAQWPSCKQSDLFREQRKCQTKSNRKLVKHKHVRNIKLRLNPIPNPNSKPYTIINTEF